MPKKLWGGRFQKELNPLAIQLSYSLSLDQRLVFFDLKTNLAYAKALTKAKILTQKEFKLLEKTIHSLQKEFKTNKSNLLQNDEDIHSSIERILTERLGELGKKIHTGKSRNDQVKTDIHLYLKNEIIIVINLLQKLKNTLCELAQKNMDIIFPGYTHFQPAQPVLLAHHLLAYYEQFSRDMDRFIETFIRADICPLGSGALAGTNYPIDRKLIAQELGFQTITHNSMDAVSERDSLLEFISNASICMMHLSRFCEELIIWSSPCMGFITLDDSVTTGSSMMPQKKNPDIAELIRGKSGRVIGNFTALITVLKGLPLTYNRDLQEDKHILFDTADTLKLCLANFTPMISSMSLNPKAIEEALSKGFLLATELADYLTKKGIPFRSAHEITGKIILYAIEKNLKLENLTPKELSKFCPNIDFSNISKSLTYEKAIEQKNSYGGTAKKQVLAQLKRIKKKT